MWKLGGFAAGEEFAELVDVGGGHGDEHGVGEDVLGVGHADEGGGDAGGGADELECALGVVFKAVDTTDGRQYAVKFPQHAIFGGSPDLRGFLNEVGNPFSRIARDDDGRASIEWGVYGVPETFVVDGKGIIRLKYVGPLTDQVLSTEIMPAIQAAQANP